MTIQKKPTLTSKTWNKLLKKTNHKISKPTDTPSMTLTEGTSPPTSPLSPFSYPIILFMKVKSIRMENSKAMVWFRGKILKPEKINYFTQVLLWTACTMDSEHCMRSKANKKRDSNCQALVSVCLLESRDFRRNRK